MRRWIRKLLEPDWVRWTLSFVTAFALFAAIVVPAALDNPKRDGREAFRRCILVRPCDDQRLVLCGQVYSLVRDGVINLDEVDGLLGRGKCGSQAEER